MHHLRPRQALAVASLVFSALTFVLANPVSHVESDPVALLARGSVYAGGKCTTNNDCYSKLCVSNVCKLQPTGGPCSENGNCVSKNCTIPAGKTNGTCSATALLYPKAACTSDFQCLSGSCSDLVDVHDQYGDETGTFLKDDPKHRGRNCQYLSLNQSGCRNNLDCSRGVCSNSECTALADGSKCLFTYQCANVCSPKGTCYSPAAGSVRTGQPCTQNSQCYGQSCRTYNLKYTRPNLQGNGTVSLTEKVCDKAYYGNPCYSDSDCYDGACLPTNSTSSTTLSCQIRAVGEPCPRDNACSSGVCPTSTEKCDLPTTGHQCTADSQCYSQSCTEGVCYGPPGYEVCPESSCDAVLYRGKCRFDKDCVTNYCNKGQCGKNYLDWETRDKIPGVEAGTPEDAQWRMRDAKDFAQAIEFLIKKKAYYHSDIAARNTLLTGPPPHGRLLLIDYEPMSYYTNSGGPNAPEANGRWEACLDESDVIRYTHAEPVAQDTYFDIKSVWKDLPDALERLTIFNVGTTLARIFKCRIIFPWLESAELEEEHRIFVKDYGTDEVDPDQDAWEALVPEGLRAVVRRCCSYDPRDRPLAEELARAFMDIC